MDQTPLLRNLNGFIGSLSPILERPAVQRQLLAFISILVFGWLFGVLMQRIQPQLERRLRSEVARRWLRALGKTYYPIFGISAGLLTNALFQQQGWLTGMLEQMLGFFLLLLAYRLLVALLYLFLRVGRADRYAGRFLRPVFFVLVIVGVDRLLAGIISLGDITLFSLQEYTITARGLFIASLIFYLFLAASWAVHDLLTNVVLPRIDSDKGVDNTILTVSQYVLVSMGLLVGLAALGINLSSLAIIGAGLSVGIGFGLQELVGNFISGILLLFEQSIRPGDVIHINDTVGRVERLRIRSTTIRTLDNVEIIVPNQTLLTNAVTTYTHSDRNVRMWVPVGVSYDAEPQQVREILLAAASRHGLVKKDPKPTVQFTGFGDSSIDFELAVWLENAQAMRQVRSDLRFIIWEQLKKHNIEIPFPQRDLHLRSGVPWEQLASHTMQSADDALAHVNGTGSEAINGAAENAAAAAGDADEAANGVVQPPKNVPNPIFAPRPVRGSSSVS